ncbi:MAG: M23 family metallopeptidase [Spirochaetes bacterium]|uniref:M23 family metallopeptidase n=1 Tax=Candidatus Avitreponema avistercoris TaxID=2840705 RepID=A0A9D9HFZ1_9SPIR|nr:M23 family metallopeptidase [Candidatus Avitreponema avistercoris]
MAKTRGYKRIENRAVRTVRRIFKSIFSAVAGFFRAVIAGAGRKITIMLVPHSQKKVINIQASVFSISLFVLLLTGIFSAFFIYSRRVITSERTLASLEQEITETRASLDRLKDETGSLLNAARNFQTSFSETLSLVGIDTASEEDSVRSGDLSSFFDIRQTSRGELPEAADLQRISSFLEDSVQPIEEIGKLLNSRDALFSDIPSLWPIQGGIGHISQMFGQNRHVFSKQWYIHKGIDLSTYRSGDPVLATADGQIVMVDYDPGFGNYVIIRHKHGFYTRYAHLLSQRVKRGEHVEQGQVIGYIGNTGISTGPHLHYEIHIGSEVVDPIKYLNIRDTSYKNQ